LFYSADLIFFVSAILLHLGLELNQKLWSVQAQTRRFQVSGLKQKIRDKYRSVESEEISDKNSPKYVKIGQNQFRLCLGLKFV